MVALARRVGWAKYGITTTFGTIACLATLNVLGRRGWCPWIVNRLSGELWCQSQPVVTIGFVGGAILPAVFVVALASTLRVERDFEDYGLNGVSNQWLAATDHQISLLRRWCIALSVIAITALITAVAAGSPKP